MKNRWYIAIDLKSFYASVECRERGLDPMTTNLVVADLRRTEKTICLAVSPALKAYGIPGRPRLFEVVQRVEEINITLASRQYLTVSCKGYLYPGVKIIINDAVFKAETEYVRTRIRLDEDGTIGAAPL